MSAGNELRGQRALVTGAGTRVGAAIARALGARGMRVGVHYHGSKLGAEQTCREIEAAGGSALALAADLYDEAQARALVRDAVAQLGGLDLLVASAGNFDHVPFQQIDASAWQRALSLNLLAPFALAQEAAAPLAAAGGSIVLITCNSRHAPYRDYLPYQVSKAALHQMMRVLALELAPRVRVNSVAPGTVLPPTDMSQGTIDALVQSIPLGRVGGADAVAQAVVHLAASPWMTGSELVVDGGQSG